MIASTITTKEASAIHSGDTTVSTPPRTNGLNEEQLQSLLALAGRHKNNPEYVRHLLEGAMEARRQINEEYLHEIDALEKESK